MMESVELARPGGVEVSKILAVEGFSSDGVLAGDVQKRELVAKDASFGSFSRDRCSTSSTDTCRKIASEHNSLIRSKKVDSGLCMFHNSLPSYVEETTASHDAKPLFTGKQLQRKAGKAPKNSSSTKRPRSEHVQGFMNKVVFGDCNNLMGKNKADLADCNFAERSPAVGQKHSLDGKRGDRRNFRPPSKARVDPFFLRAGLVNSGSSSGGGSILGIYGLKSDVHDVTKHVEEISLNDLLDGSYKHPSLSEDKGKKAACTNENLVHTVKMACSILQPCKPVYSQNGSDGSTNRKTDSCVLSTGSPEASRTDCTKGNNYMAELASSTKDACTDSTTSPLCQPKDILEQLALPPAKNLDALLLDTSKPTLSRSMNDPRLPKPMSYGASLPPFPWSNCCNGSSKAPIDTGKLCVNRSRWVRVGSIVSSVGNAPSFTDLNSVAFEHNKGSAAISFHNPCDFALPQQIPGSFDWQLKLGLPVQSSLKAPKAEAGNSPRVLAAAQTLYEMSRHAAAENQISGELRWPKKPSQKAMKARKPSSMRKTENFSSTGHSEITDMTLSSKKPKYITNNRDSGQSNNAGKGPMKWSIPTSGRSPPSRSENVEVKQLKSNFDSVKVGMMPSLKRSLDKACDTELRNAVSMDWGRGRSKNEC